LTITDNATRFIIRCQALSGATGYDVVRPIFEAAFREFGLTRLSAWWIRLGIRPERMEPGRPEQNGRHERMHATLKQETANPSAASKKPSTDSATSSTTNGLTKPLT